MRQRAPGGDRRQWYVRQNTHGTLITQSAATITKNAPSGGRLHRQLQRDSVQTSARPRHPISTSLDRQVLTTQAMPCKRDTGRPSILPCNPYKKARRRTCTHIQRVPASTRVSRHRSCSRFLAGHRDLLASGSCGNSCLTVLRRLFYRRAPDQDSTRTVSSKFPRCPPHAIHDFASFDRLFSILRSSKFLSR